MASVKRQSLLPWVVVLAAVPLSGSRCGCNDEPLQSTQGTLKVTVTNPPPNTPTIQVTGKLDVQLRDQSALTEYPETLVVLEDVDQGSWEIRVVARDVTGVPLNAVWISAVWIHPDTTTEVRVDLANGVLITAEICDGKDNDFDGRIDEPLDMPVCSECAAGMEQPLTDDDRCGLISCSGLDRFVLHGDNTAAGTEKSCGHVHAQDIRTERCVGRGQCLPANSDRCSATETEAASTGICHLINHCTEGNPEVVAAADGSTCGVDKVCRGGECVDKGCEVGNSPVCHQCINGIDSTVVDDSRCGPISCDGLDRWEARTAGNGDAQCVHVDYGDLTNGRCSGSGACESPNSSKCSDPTETVAATAATCQALAGCSEGTPSVVNVADDARCGTVDCDGVDRTELTGDNGAAGAAKSCLKHDYADLTGNRCDGAGHCQAANGPACTSFTDSTLATAGLCHKITGCESGAPSVDTYPDNTPCGGTKVCRSGTCEEPPPPSVGCADTTREGFVNTGTYPDIAGCEGAFSVPGVTRDNLVPTCSRSAGNTGTNKEGTGCSAADLCAAGWHVCLGKTEVGQKANNSCADAAGGSAPVFFAVSQHSTSGSVCDESANDNDVFGCGNLGGDLPAAKGCAPLNRVLASTQPNQCGWNQAEPQGGGPWQCLGSGASDLHEGANVTKVGCPNTSCSAGGENFGNSDKGGVLCCRD